MDFYVSSYPEKTSNSWMFWMIIFTLSVKMYILWGKNRWGLFGFQFRGLYSNNLGNKIGFMCNFFFQLISSRARIRWKKNLHKIWILLPKLFYHRSLNWNPRRGHTFLPHKIYILTLKMKRIVQNIQLLDVLLWYERTWKFCWCF